MINLGNSVLGRTVDNREIENLPLVGRDVYQLLNLTPGVQNVQNENSIGLPMEHVIINGSSDNMVGQVTYYLDGGINMTGRSCYRQCHSEPGCRRSVQCSDE